MNKKCFICEEPAVYMIKGTGDSYCESCAKESFGDLTFLVKVKEEARRLKELVDKQIDEIDQIGDEMQDKLEE